MARSAEHARELQAKHEGSRLEGIMPVEDWNEEIRADGAMTIEWEPGRKETKTIAEWIAEKGAGFLCSTEF